MGSLVLVALAFLLLVLESAVATLIPLGGYVPNLMLPIALFFGVAGEVHIVRGALTSFVLGALLDSFSGDAMGLQTFVLTACFLLARGAGVRLHAQGPLMQIVLCFVITVGYGIAVLALRAVFENPSGVDFDAGTTSTAAALIRCAIATALLSPVVLAGTARIESLGTFKREKRTLSS